MCAHFVQPVAISVTVSVCTKLPLSVGPLCATKSPSSKPAGGSFQPSKNSSHHNAPPDRCRGWRSPMLPLSRCPPTTAGHDRLSLRSSKANRCARRCPAANGHGVPSPQPEWERTAVAACRTLGRMLPKSPPRPRVLRRHRSYSGDGVHPVAAVQHVCDARPSVTSSRPEPPALLPVRIRVSTALAATAPRRSEALIGAWGSTNHRIRGLMIFHKVQLPTSGRKLRPASLPYENATSGKRPVQSMQKTLERIGHA